MKKIVFFMILFLVGCAVKKPDMCEKDRIMCMNGCNNSLCVAKCGKKYQNCIKSESIKNLGSVLYDNIYLDNLQKVQK